MNLYQVTFDDGTVLEYTKAAGSAAPLFVSSSTMAALGYSSSTPGILYSPGFQKYIVKQPLKRGSKPALLIHLNGVIKLLGNRHPAWEAEFLARFLVNNVPEETLVISDTLNMGAQPPTVKTQDNSDTHLITESFERVLEEIRTLRQDTKNMGKALVNNQKKLEAVLQEHEKKLNTTTTVDTRTCTSVPVHGSKRSVQVPITGTHFTPVAQTTRHYRGNKDQSNQPLFTHVEGYRTYKEMMAYNGYAHIVGTPLGRTIAQQLARVCKRHNIQLYMVLDAERLAVGSVNKRRDLTDGAVWTYPIEMWDVVKPYVEEQIKKHQ